MLAAACNVSAQSGQLKVANLPSLSCLSQARAACVPLERHSQTAPAPPMLHPHPTPRKSPATIAHDSDLMLGIMLPSLELGRAGQCVDAIGSELEQDEASYAHDGCPLVISFRRLTKAQCVM